MHGREFLVWGTGCCQAALTTKQTLYLDAAVQFLVEDLISLRSLVECGLVGDDNLRVQLARLDELQQLLPVFLRRTLATYRASGRTMQLRQAPLPGSLLQTAASGQTHTGAAGLFRQACTQVTQGHTGCSLKQQQPKSSSG